MIWIRGSTTSQSCLEDADELGLLLRQDLLKEGGVLFEQAEWKELVDESVSCFQVVLQVLLLVDNLCPLVFTVFREFVKLLLTGGFFDAIQIL